MPTNVGDMFYFGNVTWHGEGTKLEHPATVEEVIQSGGLDCAV